MADKAKVTLFKLAKELNLSTDTIKDFLTEQSLEVPASPNKKLTLAAWEAVVKKFDPQQYDEYQESRQHVQEEDTSGDIEQMRKKDLEELLHSEDPVETAEKVALPQEQYDGLKVIYNPESDSTAPAEETGETAAEEPVADLETPEADAVSNSETVTAKEVETAEDGTPVQEAPAEEDKNDKLSLPKTEVGRVIQEAPNKPVEKPAKKSGTDKTADTKPLPSTGGASKEEPDSSARKKRKRSRKKTRAEQLSERNLTRLGSVKGMDAEDGQAILEQEPSTRSRRRRAKKAKLDTKEIEANIKQTEKAMEAKTRKRKHRRLQGIGEVNETEQMLRISEFISTQQLATLLDQPVSELISKTFAMGQLVTINQRLDRTIIELLCSEFDYKVEFISLEEQIAEVDEEESEEDQVHRQPVVTIMGHVDHGKTSLLDYIRKANVVATEAGSITQHIGAYEVAHKGGRITFIDTPGHQAFTAMRARGANVTDIVVIVVAADDSVQQQTMEAIDHARSANVPIIIAINKIDKNTADAERIRSELAQKNLLVESWGGEYQCVEISAKKGINIDNLMDEIMLRAEMMDLKANPEGHARGVVIESKLDKGRGAMATVLIRKGTLRRGDVFVVGAEMGRIRQMISESGEVLDSVGPAQPAQILGISGVPQSGDVISVFPSEKEARQVMLHKQQLLREQSHQKIRKFTLESLAADIKDGEVRELAVIIKGDVAGSVEAIADEIMKFSNEEVRVNVVHKAVGAITESDVMLAVASNAFIIGFNVRPTQKAREAAVTEDVDIRIYRIIYEITSDVKLALEGLLSPEVKEDITATLEIRQVFRISKIGSVAGCMVLTGKVNRANRIRVLRDNVEVYDSTIAQLKRFKDDVKEVAQGFECGVQVVGYNDIKEGDILETYREIEQKRQLEL